MKQLIVIVLMLLLHGCNVIKIISISSKQEKNIKTSVPQKFNISEDNKILIKIDINGFFHKMYFDTRAPSIIFRQKGSWTDTLPEIATPKILQPKVAGGQQINRNFIKLRNAECELFSIKNWVISGIENNWVCNKAIGIIGHEEFSIGNKDERKILKLDFDRQELTFIKNVPAEWFRVKTKFRLGYITIFLKINGIEYPFGLDTGLGCAIIFSKKNMDDNIDTITNKNILYGKIFQVAGGGIISDTIEIKKANKIFLTDSFSVSDAEIMIAPKNMGNLVGIDLMKYYNWIFDYKSKNVYIQPIALSTFENEHFFRCFLGATFDVSTIPITVSTMVIDGKAEKAGLMLNDKILSVNQFNILNIPVCERKNKIKEILRNESEIIFTIQRNGETKKIKL